MKNEVVWVPCLARPSENFLLNNLYRVQSSVIQAPQSSNLFAVLPCSPDIKTEKYFAIFFTVEELELQ